MKPNDRSSRNFCSYAPWLDSACLVGTLPGCSTPQAPSREWVLRDRAFQDQLEVFESRSAAEAYSSRGSPRGTRSLGRRPDEQSCSIEFVGLDGASLPVETGSADAVLTTFTLCTIPDINAAMAEIVRVLKPGGALHFVEHGRSEDPKVAARQRRFEPIQKRIGGGCPLTRDPAALAEGAGLEVEHLDRFVRQGPKS